MKKGIKIEKILINKDHVTVYATDGSEVKLTRNQRQIFKNFNSKDFESNLIKEFSREDILSSDYCVIKDGEPVLIHSN